eukprot:CAMPEP_0184498342 /NCGR_PEP_ID=MMETSP0113_2-20130426/38701_1 /TAXON_ID=91329 /ORGANISM="Norrisiella sphaerica, Strain BC52" /LENGTH=877 /DNA_ID=CAMNT_0026885803 /DNA_START=149 /DNA_END=2779 /DNA_ORIENTATION=+
MEYRIQEGAKELAKIFPSVELEIIEGLLESVEGALTNDLLSEFNDIAKENGAVIPKLVLCVVEGEALCIQPDRICAGDFLVFTSEDICVSCVSISGPKSAHSLAYCSFQAQDPGTYELQVVLQGGKKLAKTSITATTSTTSDASLQPDKKQGSIGGNGTDAAAQVLLAAAALASQTQSTLLADIKSNPTLSIASELATVFPSLDKTIIQRILGESEGKWSYAIFQKLHAKQKQGDAKATITKSSKKGNLETSVEISEKDSKASGENGPSKETPQLKNEPRKKLEAVAAMPAMIKVGKNMSIDGPTSIQSGKVMPVVPQRLVKTMRVEVVFPSGRVKDSCCTIAPVEFGMHTLRVVCDGKQSDDFQFLCKTPVYEYASALDTLYDNLFWSWEGNWQAEIENATVQLVLAVEDNLKTFMNGMQSMLKAVGHSKDSSQLLTTLQENMGDALTKHDRTAVGRLHQAIYQFLEVGVMPWPQSFKDSVAEFERKKFKYSNQDRVKEAIRTAHAALGRHLEQATSDIAPKHPNSTYLAKHRTFYARMSNMIQKDEVDLSLMWELRPKPMENIVARMFGNSVSEEGTGRSKIMYLPSLDLKQAVGGGRELDNEVSLLSETLLGDAMMVGSMLGYEVGRNLVQDRKMIQNLLYAGFGYLTTRGGKILPTLNSMRAVLPLPNLAVNVKEEKELKGKFSPQSPPPSGKKAKNKREVAAKKLDLNHRKLKKRGKDLARMLRNTERPNGKLSLRVNTDFKQVMKLLREHHKDAWVGPNLEAVWEVMFKEKEMLIFELWYGNEMIAADIAHRVGSSLYVATRFFKQEHRKLQPGFLLALVETRALAELGFKLWDLGGTDSSPMMAYKEVVSFQMSRPEFQVKFLPCRNDKV